LRKEEQMRSSTAALTVAAMMFPALAGASAKLEPIGCMSAKTLYELLNAANRHDKLATAQLEGSACEPLQGAHYELVEERNGVSEIRLFPRDRDGDWAASRLVYTLDEMLGEDGR
jgi:hypothetical protein